MNDQISNFSESSIHPTTNHLPSSSSSSPTNILSLPDDLLAECFRLLPVNYLPSLALVCSNFAHILLHFPDHFASFRCRPFYLYRVSDKTKLVFLSVSSDLTLLATTNCILSSSSTPTSFHLSAFPLPPILRSMTNLSHAATIIIGSSLYLIGSGFNLCIDIVTGIAMPRLPALVVRSKFAAATIGGKIYVAGGTKKARTMEEYDPCSDKWRVIATDTPHGLSRCFLCAAVKDQLYFFAGGAIPSVMFAYNLSTGSWSNIALKGIRKLCPSTAHVVGACQIGDCIYLLMQSDKYIWFFGLNPTIRPGCNSFKEYRWTTIKYCEQSVVHFGCTAIGDNKLGVLIEALSENAKTDVTIMVFDFHTFEWIHVPDLVSPLNSVAFTGICSWA